MKGQKIVAVSRQYSGPLPQPADLEKYDKIVPGAAERILQMAEKEQEKRHVKEEKRLDFEIKLATRGQWMGLVLAVLFAVISVYFAVNGFEKLAALFGTPLIVWVCSIFVLGKAPKDQ